MLYILGEQSLHGGRELLKSIACLSSVLLAILSQRNSDVDCELDEISWRQQPAALQTNDSSESVSVTFPLCLKT